MSVLMNATHNENGSVINGEPYTHRYYRIGEKVGNAFKDSLSLKY